MNGPTKPNEQSMEEILASIRKIIAEDPSKSSSTPRPAAAPEAVPAVPAVSPSSASASTARPGAPFGRLSEALRSTFATTPPLMEKSEPAKAAPVFIPEVATPAAPPSAPRMGKPFDMSDERSQSINSELDDILNEPFSNAAASPAPLRGFEPPAEKPAAGGSQWAVWRTASGTKSQEPLQSAPEKRMPSLGSASAAEPTISPPPPRPSSGGFYPASGSFGSAPATFEPTAVGKPPASDRYEPRLPAAPPPPSAPTGGFGAVVPKRDDTFGARLNAAAAGTLGAASGAARFEPALPTRDGSSSGSPLGEVPSPPAPVSTDAPPAADVAPSPTPAFGGLGGKSGPVVIAAMPAARSQGEAAAVSPAVAEATPAKPIEPVAVATPAEMPAKPVTEAAAPAAAVSVPLPPRTALFSRPFTPVQPTPSGVTAESPSPSSIPRPADSGAAHRGPALPLAAAQIAASTSALDALAAGLAASNVHASPPAAPAGPVEAAAQPAGGAPPRTLEDAVADMVKPMLQKWIDDNMPRIIEKALRVEAKLPKDGPKT